MPAQYKWTVVGDVLLNYGTPGPVPDELWQGMLKEMKKPHVKKYLPAIVSSEPNSLQRKQAIEILKEKRIPVALVTDDKMVRGLAMAASWLGTDVKAFSWIELEKAFRYLKVPPTMDQALLKAIDDLKTSCGGR